MIISDLYETVITCSSYNIDMGSNTTTVTVTVTLKDFNKANVTGKNVELTCDKGYFNRVVHSGGTASLNNAKSTGSRSTNSNGQIVATWVATEWGLTTFSANNTKIQVNVDGWKKVQTLSTYSGLYVNEGSKTAMVVVHWDNLSIGNTDVHTLKESDGETVVYIPEKYRPEATVFAPATSTGAVVYWMSRAGALGWRATKAGTYTVETVLTWNLK